MSEYNKELRMSNYYTKALEFYKRAITYDICCQVTKGSIRAKAYFMYSCLQYLLLHELDKVGYELNEEEIPFISDVIKDEPKILRHLSSDLKEACLNFADYLEHCIGNVDSLNIIDEQNCLTIICFLHNYFKSVHKSDYDESLTIFCGGVYHDGSVYYDSICLRRNDVNED